MLFLKINISISCNLVLLIAEYKQHKKYNTPTYCPIVFDNCITIFTLNYCNITSIDQSFTNIYGHLIMRTLLNIKVMFFHEN